MADSNDAVVLFNFHSFSSSGHELEYYKFQINRCSGYSSLSDYYFVSKMATKMTVSQVSKMSKILAKMALVNEYRSSFEKQMYNNYSQLFLSTGFHSVVCSYGDFSPK